MEREGGDGMTTTIGRVEKEELFDNGIKYMLFSHNKMMGAAKGAVLLAEMLHKKDKIKEKIIKISKIALLIPKICKVSGVLDGKSG